ncbi:MAG: clan AA aspartic protease [Thaumarchaeota archaeon]|nr:clan AA aspartic protease [Nitrososphaerota archaeon]
MSSFLDLTPTVGVRLENTMLGKAYPTEESVLAVIDSGYEGFVAVPRKIFRVVALDELQLESRTLVLANGYPLTSEGAYATLGIPQISFRADGFVESYEGLDEILLGSQALRNLRVYLDYCSKRVRLQKCR